MNNNISIEDVRNRFCEIKNNSNIIASVYYEDNNGDMIVEHNCRIICKNDLFGLANLGYFVKLNEYTKFVNYDGFLNISEPIDCDNPKLIVVAFEEHKKFSF